MAKGYDWATIKAEYETGRYTMRELSDKHGFSENYGARKSLKEKWEKGVSKEKVKKEAAKKVIEEEANKEANLRKEYEKIINNIRRGSINCLFNEKDFDRLKQFKIASEIIRNCRKEQWEVNEILEVADRTIGENQDEKLDQFINAVHKMDVE